MSTVEKENIPSGIPSMADIKKSGYLKKLKTMRKKFFVLRGESNSGPARLEYYDNEKKFRAGALTKRTIYLRSCFNINRKSDAKNKCALALYTRDDCFSMVADDEETLTEWLGALLEQQQAGVDGVPVPAFEHVWQVSVKPKGLGSSKNLSGSYRLCLTSSTINLVKMNCENEDLEFSLSTIRRCGHSDCFFFMEVGRQAETGAGELWMQVEDTVIAQNIHEAALNAMRSISQQEEMRPRSHSGSSTDGKPITAGRRQPTALGPSWRARCDSMPVGTRPTRTSLSRLSSHESDEGTIPKEETSPSSGVIRPRTRSEGESGQFRSHRSASGSSSLLKYGSKLRPRTASEGESHFRTGRAPESPTKGRGRFSNIRNSTSSLRPTSVHRMVAQPNISNSPPIPNSPLSESPSQQGIAEERYVTYGPGDSPGPDDYGYGSFGNSPGEPHYSRPHHGSLRCRTPESPTHTPIREESLEFPDEYMNMSPSASSKALPVPQGRRFSAGSSSMNRFGTFPFRHHSHHHHHQHVHTAGSAGSEPSMGHNSPYEPDSYMAMNPGQKRSNSAGFLCTTPTTSTNSLASTNHRSGSISKEAKATKDVSANGNEGYMMMAPSTKGSKRASGSIDMPIIRHSSADEPESYMMMTPPSRSSSISGRPEHSTRSASLDLPPSHLIGSPSQQLTDSYMNMEFQNRRANSLDKDAAIRSHRKVTRSSSATSSEEPASYMNVSFGASSPKSPSSNEGYAYMEPAQKKDKGSEASNRRHSYTSSHVPRRVAQSDGTAPEEEGEYVNVNFDQRKNKSSGQNTRHPKRNVPPALILKNSASDTSEYMNVEPGSRRRTSPSTRSPTSPAAQALRNKTLEKSLEEMKLQQGCVSPGKSSVGSPKSGSPRISTSSGSPHSGSPRLSSHNGVRNLLLGSGQSRSCEPSPRLSSRHTARRSSDSSSPLDEKELNYIDVDIGAPDGKSQSNIERRARSPFHRRTPDEDKQAEPTNYATIDFTKSEGLRQMTNKRQHESRH